MTEHRHYLQAAGLTVALAVVRSGTGVSATHANPRMRPTQVTYYQQDHLGSIAVVTDANGAVLDRMAYDPWGKRRKTDGLADTTDSLVGKYTDRGFTEHEHLDEVGVIHMNGRLYDPLVGRFMSADPFIQSPENLQSYNRFAYVMNNPLAYTDPSGYWSWKKFRQAVIMIGVAVTLGPAASGYLYTTWGVTAATASIGQVIVAGAISGAVAGYAGGYLSVIATGGNSAEARAAAKSGAISGMLFGAAGGVGDANSWSRLAAHATAGCVSSVSGGGKCGEGAASAVFGKWTTNAIGAPGMNDSPAELVAKGVATMVAGGVGSVIAGGKFASGAETAAYGYLFNAMSKVDLRRVFRNISAAGHHYVPYGVASAVGVSMEAAAEFAKSGTGIIPDYGSSDNPHRGHSRAHIDYDNAVRSELDAYMKSKGVMASELTTNHAKEFIQQIRTSNVPEIKDFNNAIRAHILNNALKLAPPRSGD